MKNEGPPDYIYRCFFRDIDDDLMHVDTTQGLWVVKDGFWVNREYQLTSGDDARYWIPPHRIMGVIKFPPDKE